MSAARRCGYCQQPFQPSPYRPQQTVCSNADCQRRRRADNHRHRIQTDPEYRQVCLDSPRKWRAQHPDYWRNYRQAHPQAVEQNRRKQRDRDQASRLTDLANNNLAFDVKSSAAKVYWIGPRAADLANNNPLVRPPVLPDNRLEALMLTVEQIHSIHNLQAERWSLRRIARQLQMDTRTVKKYLQSPLQTPVSRPRASKLDTFKSAIDELLEQDPQASAAVIAQRLKPLGFTGGRTILQGYVRDHRPAPAVPRAFVRMEPNPGDRFEVDWGHFDALDYVGDKRKLYAFVLVECHSRMMYVEFTHSQGFETFVRCHIHAFHALGGCSREIWFDNLATAVAEHDGRLVRFNPRFFAFAREYGFFPRACNRAAGWEKGKVERAGIGYIRQNFWPLRQFSDLHDVNRQAQQWLKEVANQRLHRETRERPVDRFQPAALRSLPALTPDYRDSVEALVHKDIRISFDGNRYCAPPQLVGQKLIVKANSSVVTLYQRHKEIVSYARCWKRGQTIGAERYEKELLASRPAAACSQAQRRLTLFLEQFIPRQTVESYLRGLAETDRSLSRQINELLNLIPQYGADAVATALATADKGRAFGSDYVANILRQQLCPRVVQPPVRLRDPLLNELVTDPLSLLEYDAFILSSRKETADELTREAGPTQAAHDEPTTGSNTV